MQWLSNMQSSHCRIHIDQRLDDEYTFSLLLALSHYEGVCPRDVSVRSSDENECVHDETENVKCV